MYFILIILIIVMSVLYSNKCSENDFLKKEITRLCNTKRCIHCNNSIPKDAKFCKICGTNQSELNVSIERQEIKEKVYTPDNYVISEEELERRKQRQQVLKEQNENTRKQEEQRKVLEEQESRENKNVAILTTGAGLIIVAAIVFLMSTWNSVNDALKTIVLMLLVCVFTGASNIARNKFGLEKASKTFLYMAMGYIPICLISISVLGLFGEFLSFGGEGRYIYLSLSSLLIAFIYYLVYKKESSNVLYSGSIIFQMFALIFGICTISVSVSGIVVGLLLYILILQLMNDPDDEYIYMARMLISQIILYTVAIGAIFTMGKLIVLMPVILILLAINFLILSAKEGDLFACIGFNIFLNLVGVYFITSYVFEIPLNLKPVLLLINFVIIYAVQYIRLANIKKSSVKLMFPIVSFAFLQLLYLYNLIQNTVMNFADVYTMKSYVIVLVQIGMLIITYGITNKEGKRLISAIIPLFVIIGGLTAIRGYALPYHAYIIFGFTIFAIGELLINKIMRKSFFTMSHVFIFLTFVIQALFNYNEFKNDAVYFILLMMVYLYTWLKNKSEAAKYLSYITFNIALTSIAHCLKLPEEAFYIIPAIVTIAITYFEKSNSKLQDVISPIFLSIYQILSILCLTALPDITNLVMIMLFAGLLIYENKIAGKTNYSDIIPVSGMLFGLFICNPVIATPLSIILTILLTAYSLVPRNLNLYSLFSLIALVISLGMINQEYINVLLVIIWAATNIFAMDKEAVKDLYRIILAIATLNMYLLISGEIGLSNYPPFILLGFIITAIYIIRNILKKYIGTIEIVEVPVFVIIYFVGMFTCINPIDGILALLILVSIIILSYVKKYGALFCTTIIALIINTIYMTRSFWLMVPWWAYFLGFGSILISFAIKNEMSEKTNSKNIFEKIKEIKEIKDNIEN